MGLVTVDEEMDVPSETVLEVDETEYHSLDQTELMKTRPMRLLASRSWDW